jgi:hypothetical protein
MRDLKTLDFHPQSEQIVDYLSDTTRNPDRQFFRVLTAYYLGKIAASMRAVVVTKTRSTIPVNVFAINLAPSGYGKGHSTNIMEEIITKGFRDKFMDETFDQVAEIKLAKMANERAAKFGGDEDDEMTKLRAEFAAMGEIVFSFDSGSTPAMKQMRYKMIMAEAGAVNLEIDEIGSNLLGNVEILTSFLELYDKGRIKQKLTKNTAENSRGKDIDGGTPTNAMLYGTPSKLFDGSRIEEEFYSTLETGYARRCIFGFARKAIRDDTLTAEQIYDTAVANNSTGFLDAYASHLTSLADPGYFNRKLLMEKDVELIMLEYSLRCEKLADEMGEYEEIRKAEMAHRYFRALKIAGAYAFVDGSDEVTEDHIYYAIALVEESGKAFEELLNRERPWVKLAKYLASCRTEVTHADIVEDLPFYKGSASQKADMLSLATAWGYNNHVIIRKSYVDGIEFISGESLEPVDLQSMRLSYSTHIADGYQNQKAPFDQLHKLTQYKGLHWTSHLLANGDSGTGHRAEENILDGFDMIVLDVDEGTRLETVRELFSEFKYMIYTTKRHTDEDHRFRIILPMNYKLSLSADDYKEFMQNLYEWLPFGVDEQTGQRARKWLSHDGDYEYNDGQLLDVLPFIPRTRKNEIRKQELLDTRSLNNLERWFVYHTGTGNRSNQLFRYARILVDAGQSIEEIRTNVLSLNNKIPDKLEESEILSTIMVSVSKAYSQRQAA